MCLNFEEELVEEEELIQIPDLQQQVEQPNLEGIVPD